MSLIKWEPFDDFDRFFRELSPFSQRFPNMNLDLACDVYEDGDDLVAEMNLPGMKGEDINVEVEGDHLRISGSREEVDEKKEKSHYAKEIRRGSFDRMVPLPNPVKKEGVSAVYENGVLKVRMPKSAEEEDKRIKVEVR